MNNSNTLRIKNQPLVSVIVCTYNQEQYIQQTLDSILMQQCTFQIEILVGEDCGSDSTRKICQQYEERYPNVVHLLERESNLGKQRNFFDALVQCKGKYISMCDGDDYWQDSTMLQKEVDFLEEHEDFVIVYHDSVMVDETGKIISETEVGEGRRCDFSSDELIKGRNISNRTICFRNMVDFSKIDISGVYNEDTFVYSIIGQYGKGHFITGLQPSVYRILNGSIWNDQSESKRLMWAMGTTKAICRYYKSKQIIKYEKFFYEKYFQHNDKLLFYACTSKNIKLAFKALNRVIFGVKRKNYIHNLVIAVKSVCKSLFI